MVAVNKHAETKRSKRWIADASLCSLAIALWGWQTGLFFAAIPIIALIEGRHLVKQRWAISLADIKEAAKLGAAILAILLVVLITTEKSLFIYALLQWLPVAGLPLLMAQTYGLDVQSRLSEWAASPHLQQPSQQQSITTQKSGGITLHHSYVALCIVAASAANTDQFIFYGLAAGLSALTLWPLQAQRSAQRSAPIVWLLLFCLSAGLGFAGHQQLDRFQQKLEAEMIAMLGEMMSGSVNPDGNATRMGSVGRLKLSNKIIARIATEADESTFPLLLQEATYDNYQLSTWSATNSIFRDVPPGNEDGEWILGPTRANELSLTLSTDLKRAEGLLTLPRGVSRLQQLPVEEMQRNQYGAVQVNATGDVAYTIQFLPPLLSAATFTDEAAPTQADLQIPKADLAAVETTLSQLPIANKSNREIANLIAAHFQNFQPSLDLLQPDPSNTPVADFLLNTQKGHCEYFASATTLLLRAAGIPARYAVGYSAHEFSPLENQYIVRQRDAHAWTLAYLDDHWQTLDTTPPDWTTQDAKMSSSFERVADFFSFLGYQLSVRIRQLGEMGLKEILMIVIPLFCYLLWRSVQQFQGQQKELTDESLALNSLLRLGLDSELYEIEQQLASQGLERQAAESFLQWCDRLQPHLPNSQLAALKDILHLHYRYRFDPNTLGTADRKRLKALSQQWILDNEKEQLTGS